MPALHRIELSPAKIWSDERGWGIEPFEAAGLPPSQLGNCHVVSLKPNAIRGNHFHTGTTEWLLICGGPIEVAWRTEDQPTKTLTVKEPVPTLLEIPPFVEHALRNLSQTEVILVSFSNHGERDTVCCSMLFD